MTAAVVYDLGGMERDVFRMKKQSAVLGTCEPAAFILSLRDGNEFCKTHSSGYHCIPHIGVYGENYTVCSPIALISLPPTPGCLQQLPLDLQGALDLVPLCEQTMRVPRSRKLGIGGVQTTMRAGAFDYSVKEGEMVAESDEEERLLNEPGNRHVLNPVWAAGTIDTVKEEEEGEDPEERVGYGSSPISIVIQSADAEDHSHHQTLRSLAKKIVMNALHKACQVLGASCRRGSIDYLVASTKRLRVGRSPSPLKELREGESPSPLPMDNHEGPLHPRLMEGAGLDTSCVDDGDPNTLDMRLEGSPSTDCRRKRSRSHSQDSNAMQELNVFRLQKGIGIGLPNQEGEREELPFNAYLDVNNIDEVQCGSLQFGLGTIGIQAGMETSGLQLGLGTSGLQLSLGTSGPQLGLGTSGPQLGLGTSGPQLGLGTSGPQLGLGTSGPQLGLGTSGPQLGLGTSGPQLGLGTSGPQLGLGTSGPQLGLGTSGPQLGLGTSGPQLGLGTMINGLQKLSLAVPFSHPGVGDQGTMGHPGVGDHGTMGAMCLHPGVGDQGTMGVVCLHNERDSRDHLNFCGSPVPDIDMFIVIHAYPPPSVCQKFLCYKDNEVNLMYHFWLFPDAPLEDSHVRQEALEMGVFHPLGVTPVHQNLRDGGVAFHYMDHRTVCIHQGSFSPENAQLELERGSHLHVFFSAARSSSNNRKVITYHVVPGDTKVEQQLRNTIGRCSTLSELVEGLSSDFPEPGATIHRLINSLQR